MPTYRFTIRSEYVTVTDIEAENEVKASEEMDLYLEEGGIGDSGWWNTRVYDEPEILCKCCNNPYFNYSGLKCCGRSDD